MMTCKIVGAGKAKDYFEHEMDYYTKNLSCLDRWHGVLAESRELKGDLSKEQFDYIVDEVASKRDPKSIGLDCTFSAPKSVSLALAADEKTRQDMINAHQAALSKIVNKIEMEYLETRSKKKTFLSRNAIAAEFTHLTARPTEENNFIPDLDLHGHVIFLNETFADGKNLAQSYKKVMDAQKELGLMYRQELAQELQKAGYALQITNEKQGFFELAGFDRATIEEYSHRRKEILRTAEENGITNLEQANLISRSAKEKTRGSYEEIIEQTKADLFENGRIKIERSFENGKEIDRGGDRQFDGQRELHDRWPGEPDLGAFRENARNQELETFGRGDMLPDLQMGDLASEENGAGSGMFLSRSQILYLGKRQSAKVRDLSLRRADAADRKRRITYIAEKTIEELSREKYAFSVKETRQRIMAAGVLEGITREEADKEIENAGAVKLGRIERDGKKSRDVYLTTEKNIETERAVLERVEQGKKQIQNKILTVEESRAALDRVEAEAREKGKTDFSIKSGSGEQAEAVHHILTCEDQYVCVDGLAGTGKTTMIERLNWICQEQGIEIKGCCFTGKAADGLQNESGIESKTIHGFLNRLERESGITTEQDAGDTNIKQEWDFSRVEKTKGREIWAVDEAGFVDMHLMNQLQKAAEARGAQLLLLGDPLQLPPVGAGKPMEQMEEKGMATAHLYDIRRQKKEFAELRDAVRESVQGKTLVTFKKLDEVNCYHEIEGTRGRREAITKEMTADKLEDYDKKLLLTSTNADRKAYNKAIRAEYVRRGELEKGKEYIIEGNDGKEEKRHFAKGDRIIFTKNDNQLNVMNGTRAEVTYTNGKYIGYAVFDKDKLIQQGEIDTEKYKSLDHAYAVTNYKAQGMTVDKVVVDMNTKGAAQTRNALYVDISRARKKAVVYTDDKEKLERQSRDFAKKITSKDFSQRLARMEREQGIRNNDRYHAPENGQEKLNRALEQIEKHTLSFDWGTPGGKTREVEQPKREQERQPEPSKTAKDMSVDIRRIQQERSAAVIASMEKDIKGITSDRARKKEMEDQKKIEAAKEKARSLIEKAKGRGEMKVEREMPRVRAPEMDLGFSR
jgi:conjugative relaxase-like TrwC/TraI family protein